MKRSRLVAARHQIALHSIVAPGWRGRGSSYGRASNSLRACPQRQKFNRRDRTTPSLEVIRVSKRGNLLVFRLATAVRPLYGRVNGHSGSRNRRDAARMRVRKASSPSLTGGMLGRSPKGGLRASERPRTPECDALQGSQGVKYMGLGTLNRLTE